MICFERLIVERLRIVKRRDSARFETGRHGNRRFSIRRRTVLIDSVLRREIKEG